MPIFGIKNLKLAHREASCNHKLKNMDKTPMFVLKTENDPVIGPNSVDDS